VRDRAASLPLVAREWARIGVTGFGGPPAHVALLRELVVDRRSWLHAEDFEDANAAVGLLPGPASTQLAIYCAYRVAGPAGAIVGGLCFIVPAVVAVIVLSAALFGHSPPLAVRGAGAGAGAAVAAVALHAARGLLGPSLGRARERREQGPWAAFVLAGLLAAWLIGPYLALVLVGCGLVELARRRRQVTARPGRGGSGSGVASLAPLWLWPGAVAVGGLGALVVTAFKVGALSFGGGFVIIPLMQGDAVHVNHWMTAAQFQSAVALGQVTPGPVVATVAAVGYAARGVGGGAIAAAIAFAPSFMFVLLAGRRFERLRGNKAARAFLDGAGPAAIGAIAGAAVTLATGLSQGWQFAVLAAAIGSLFVLRRGVVLTLVAAGAIGVIAAVAGASLP
jgi:chromate transporter